MSRLAPEDYWRAVVLYGANTATYKLALASVLIDEARQEHTEISMQGLARAFFALYRLRARNGLPQQSIPGRKTVMEQAVEAYERGEITEEQAVARIERRGFNDVVPGFHTVNGAPVPLRRRAREWCYRMRCWGCLGHRDESTCGTRWAGCAP